uniref:Uncharacterized protein n=1 Tax=Sphaerodactylus townsendi TaxID=933632 RepID=A0ACB8FR15_9SAUR
MEPCVCCFEINPAPAGPNALQLSQTLTNSPDCVLTYLLLPDNTPVPDCCFGSLIFPKAAQLVPGWNDDQEKAEVNPSGGVVVLGHFGLDMMIDVDSPIIFSHDVCWI